ncbi:MAG: hypothetical protein IT357_06960 [Gemmatimonadaceae bacterium]|nr:hypothetical protein [Gemmatimonadaceae bacterium]
MAHPAQSHDDVLHATDTALRLVNQALGDLGTAEGLARVAVPMAEKGAHGNGSLLQLASTLLRAYAEVASLLDRIKQSRGILQEAADARLEQMNKKLSAVTTATEMAATGMLDGLDRAIAVVTELEQEAEESQDLVRHARYTALREELYGVMTFIQFQDITSQQLGYAAAVINDTEKRLEQLTGLFEPFAADVSAVSGNAVPHSAPKHFDPNAVADKTDSQAFADSLFGR